MKDQVIRIKDTAASLNTRVVLTDFGNDEQLFIITQKDSIGEKKVLTSIILTKQERQLLIAKLMRSLAAAIMLKKLMTTPWSRFTRDTTRRK